MKIVVPGGTGQVGTVLARAFGGQGHEVVVLGRGTARDGGPTRHVRWDARTLGAWADELEGADALVNLAGRSVNCRYNATNRREIMDSRVESTRVLGEAMREVERPPPVWLQASTATIYAHRFDAANDEAGGRLGGNELPNLPDTWRFSYDVAHTWEQVAREAAGDRTRLVLLRSAVVMNPDPGSAFDVLLGLVHRGLGGTAGNGRQWVSWIHHEDFTRALAWLLEHDTVAGPVNIAAPDPLPNAAFMRALRRAWGARVGLPATAWMLEVGAVLVRTETELILKSRRVVPGRLLDEGFEFAHARWSDAARELCTEWRSQRP